MISLFFHVFPCFPCFLHLVIRLKQHCLYKFPMKCQELENQLEDQRSMIVEILSGQPRKKNTSEPQTFAPAAPDAPDTPDAALEPAFGPALPGKLRVSTGKLGSVLVCHNNCRILQVYHPWECSDLTRVLGLDDNLPSNLSLWSTVSKQSQYSGGTFLEAAGREAMDLISQNQELLEAFTEAWQCIAWISMDLTDLTICLWRWLWRRIGTTVQHKGAKCRHDSPRTGVDACDQSSLYMQRTCPSP